MTDPADTPDDPKPHRVRSDLAEPSRPEGYYGVRQPLLPDPPVYPPRDQPPDGDLHGAVCAALSGDGRLEGCRIDVALRSGVVTLRGEVLREFQRTLAYAVTETVPGVLTVENQLVATG